MFKFLTRWMRGDKFSSRHLNEVLEVADRVNPISGDGAATVTQGVHGTSISVPPQTNPRQTFRAVIVKFLGYDYDPDVSELQIGTALYEAKLIRESPAGIYIDHNDIESVPIVGPGETDPGTWDIVVINEAEVGRSLGGFLSMGDVITVWPTAKFTNNTDPDNKPMVPKKIYRTDTRFVEFKAKITGNDGTPTPYYYSYVEMEDTTRPAIDVKRGGRSGTITVRYATNAYDPANFPQIVPNDTIVKMKMTYDTSSGQAVFTFWYLGLSVGLYCDQAIPIYVDQPSITELSFHRDDFTQSGQAGDIHRTRIRTKGFTVTDYTGDGPVCNTKILKFDQGGVFTGIPEDPVYGDVTGYTTVPIVFTLLSATVAGLCGECDDTDDQVEAVIKGFGYVPPGSSPIIKHYGVVVGSGTGQYSIYDFGAGILPIDNTTYVEFLWTGFLAEDYTGTAVGSGSLETGAGYTTIKAGAANVVFADLSGGLLQLSTGVFGDNGSGSLGSLFQTIKNNGGVTITDLGSGVMGLSVLTATQIVAIDCTVGLLSGTFSTIQSTYGITLSGVSGTLQVGLNVADGTYIKWHAASGGCPAVPDIDPGTFAVPSDLTTLQTTIEAYADAAVGTAIPAGTADVPMVFSGTTGSIGGWSTASPPLAPYGPGNPSSWSGTPPANAQDAWDRLAANNAAILAALNLFGIPGLPGNP